MDARVIRSSMWGTVVCLALCFGSAADAQQSGSVSEKLNAATESAKTSVQQAGAAASDKISQLWERIDERRLKNRTRDEIVGG